MKHYRTLDIKPDATAEEIKKAYRQAASIHHPDKGGSAAIFQEVQLAWETLGDPDKKKQYDESESKKPVEKIRESMDILVDQFANSCRQ